MAEAENLNTFKNILRCHLANFSSEHLVKRVMTLCILYLLF